MKRPDLVELAMRNLRESKLRNSLTTLGIAVGVASLVAMLALGVGLQQLAAERLGQSGIFDTVVVFSKRDITSFDGRERRLNPSNADARPLDLAVRRQIEALPGVAEVYPEIRFLTEIRYRDESHFTRVAALPMSARDNEAFEGMQGKYFSAGDAEEAILEEEFARGLSDHPESLLGQTITLRYGERQPLAGDSYGFSIVRRERDLRIVGITKQEPFGGVRRFASGNVFIPTPLAESLNVMQRSTVRDVGDQTGDTYDSLLVRVNRPSQAKEVQDAIDAMGFTTWSALNASKSIRRFFVILDLFLGIFGSLAIAVASLAIVNTLVMSVLERRREIGIMKALGASDSDVRRLFFAEAGCMGIAGGLLGVGLGWLIGHAVNFGTNIYLQRQLLPPETIWTLPLWLALAAIAFALVVSLISGIYPAARAARLDPVQALRYE